MKIRNIFYGAASALALAAGTDTLAQQSDNVNATEPYGPTAIQPQIRLNLEKETEKVHFIRNNTDPYVITKIYPLRNADVYEVRPYVTAAVRSKKITQNNTYVESIKFNNGLSFLIVSAEEDRFGKQENGMGIDELISALDQPKITASSGSVRYVYFPRYRKASELKDLIWNVGAVHNYDGAAPIYNMVSSYELQQGKDRVYAETGLNALFFFIPKWSKKNIDSMLQYYDQPILQAEIKYSVYEIYAENDGKIGADFQSWKNNDGLDLLSVGGRYRSNWASTYSGGIDPTGSNKTQFFNFNPKWNSKYLDFLVSKSKAKILTEGKLLIKNNETATINKTSRVMYNQYVANNDDTLTQTVTAAGTILSAKPGAVVNDQYYFSAANNGNAITLTDNASSISSVKISSGGVTKYQLIVEGTDFVADGASRGSQTTSDSFVLYKGVSGAWVAQAWSDDIKIAKGPTINTLPSNGFGFLMTIGPQICQDSTTLSVKLVNSSLIGWKSSGEPRIAQNNEVKTDVMLSNQGNRFVIGGVDKETVVRNVTGVPFLRELPGVGWLFSTESESTKRSQLVVVAECRTRAIDAPLTEATGDAIQKINQSPENAGEKNKWGFDQLIFDKEKKGLDPLP